MHMCIYARIYICMYVCMTLPYSARTVCMSSHTFTPNEAEQTPIHPSVHPCMHAYVFTGFCAYTYEC